MGKRSVITGIIIACVLLGAAALLKAAQHAGLIDPDSSTRVVQAMMGLVVAFYGNFVPKSVGRMRSVAGQRRMQKALRVSGWAFVLAGLAYAALALLAPPSLAFVGSIAVMAAMVLTILLFLRCIVSPPASAAHPE